MLKIEPKYIIECLKFEYENRMRGKWGESIYRKIVDVEEFAYPTEERITETHKELLRLRRESDYF